MSGTLKIVHFSVGTERFCSEMSLVRRIERNTEIHILDGKPYGWVTILGDRVPVLDGWGALGAGGDLPGRDRQESRQLVLFRTGPHGSGLLVDQVYQGFEISRDDLLPLPLALSHAVAPMITGLVPRESNFIFFLSPEHFFKKRVAPPHSSDRDRLEGTTGPPTKPSPAASPGLVRFHVGAAEIEGKPVSLGLSLSQVVEIIDPPPVIRVPTAVPPILGLISWRGRPVPLLDLFRSLRLNGTPAAGKKRAILARLPYGEELLAFPVDPDIQITPLPQGFRPRALPPTLPAENGTGTRVDGNSPPFLGAFENDSGILIIPDIEKTIFQRLDPVPRTSAPGTG